MSMKIATVRRPVLKRRIVRDLLGCGLVATLALTGLTGCGRSDAPAADDDTASAAIDDAPATGTIEIWTAENESTRLEPFAKAFEQANPDVKLKFTDVPWAELNTKISSALATGKTPDLIENGGVRPFLASGGLQTVPDGVLNADEMLEESLKIGQRQDGTQVGVPWYTDTRFTYYNTKVLKRSDEKAPTTWDEETALLKKFKKQGVKKPLVVSVGYNGVNDAASIIMPFLSQAGGSPLNDDRSEWTFDTPEMIAALEHYQQYFDLGLAAADGIGDDSLSDISTGAAGSTVQGPYLPPQLDAAMASKGEENFSATHLTAAVLPSGEANNNAFIGGTHWAVPKDAKNADAAWKFVKWLSDSDTQKEWYAATQYLPSNTEAWKDEAMQQNPFTKVALEQLQHTVAEPMAPSWDELRQMLCDQSELLVSGKSRPEKVAKALQAKSDELGTGW